MSRTSMNVVVVSPHYDDAVFSVGPWLVNRQGKTVVLTVFTAGDGDCEIRREEDEAACRQLRVYRRDAGCIDAVFRNSMGTRLYNNKSLLAGRVHPGDEQYADTVLSKLSAILEEYENWWYLFPAGIGGHVDHLITARYASEYRQICKKVLLYEDVPYVVIDRNSRHQTREALKNAGWIPSFYEITAKEEQRAITAACLYESQVKRLFGSTQRAAAVIRQYLHSTGQDGGMNMAVRLWTNLRRRC